MLCPAHQAEATSALKAINEDYGTNGTFLPPHAKQVMGELEAMAVTDHPPLSGPSGMAFPLAPMKATPA